MNPPNVQIFTIDNMDVFREYVTYIEEENFPLFTLDCETNSKSEKLAKLYGIGLCFTKGQAVYIPIRRPDGTSIFLAHEEKFIADWIFQQAKKRRMVGHNISYDVLVLEYNWGFDFSPYIYSDTILLKHAINEEQPFALKEVAVNYLGEWADKAQDQLKGNVLAKGGRWNSEHKDMYLADTDILAEYCGYDCILTMYLYCLFSVMLHKEGLEKLFYQEETMPLYREVTIDMKRRGFHIDVPYYEKLKAELTTEIAALQLSVMEQVDPLIQDFIREKLDKEVPVKKSGAFPKALAEVFLAELPKNKKTGAITLAKKDLQNLLEVTKLSKDRDYPLRHSNQIKLLEWLLAEDDSAVPFDSENVQMAQGKVFFSKTANEDMQYIFNLSSSTHLGWLFFKKLGLKPLSFTDHGQPQCDDDFLDTISDQYPFVKTLIDYKKLEKLLSTYVIGILDRQIDGIIYTSMLQFGTISGRYSSRDPNLQNQPRVKDEESKLSTLVLHYTNAIRRGFIAPPGYVVVNADYSSLEPVCFAHMSGDEKLRDVFRKKYDLYSQIAIESFGMSEYSADKKAINYLGKLRKEVRQQSKIFCLAVPYGAEASRISQAMKIPYREAEDIINKYLDAFPNLRLYMDSCNVLAKTRGKVQTEFGRIRHLPKAKRLFAQYGDRLLNYHWAKEHNLGKERYELKNALNNAKNMPIQGLAAHLVNRAMIAMRRAFKKHNIDGYIALQVHDEITCIVREDQAQLAVKLQQEAMENTTKISVPLVAEPKIAKNWADAK